MKSFRSTWLMSLIVFGLAAYTVFEYKKSQSEGGLAENERLAFTLSPDQAVELKIKRGEETIILSKKGEEWQMIEPVEDKADLPSVQGYLYTLLSERVRTFRIDDDAKKAPDWSEVGLDKPAALIEVSGAGKTEALSIGGKNAFDGSFYVREKDELLLGDTGFAQLRDRTANSFRTRRLWRESSAEVERVDLNLEGDKYSLVKTGGHWSIEPKPAFAVDEEKIEEWIERMQGFSPSEIVKDGIEARDKVEFLLLKPSFIASVGKDWVFTAGQDRAEDVFVYTNKRNTIYKTSQSGLSDIRVKRSYFRNGHKGFSFPLEQVRRIEVAVNGNARAIVKNDSGWALEGADSKDFELDQGRLATFLQNVRSLNGKEFFAKGEGFANPQIIMRDAKGGELFALSWGAQIKGKNDIYVRTNLEKEVMSLSKDKIDELIPREMVRKKK